MIVGHAIPRGKNGLTRGGVGRLLLGLLGAAIGCAHSPDPTASRSGRELTFAYDDNHASASLTFPNLTYETLIRFELPTEKHRPLRLHLMAESAGTIAISFYENSVLECPGDEIRVITRELGSEDLSKGKDGRWIVEDLRDLPPFTGTVWVGVHKVGGAPAIWTSAVVSGQTYLRNRDPASVMGLLPVKRTPMIRLDLDL